MVARCCWRGKAWGSSIAATAELGVGRCGQSWSASAWLSWLLVKQIAYDRQSVEMMRRAASSTQFCTSQKSKGLCGRHVATLPPAALPVTVWVDLDSALGTLLILPGRLGSGWQSQQVHTSCVPCTAC